MNAAKSGIAALTLVAALMLAMMAASSYGKEPLISGVDITFDIQPDLSVKETLAFTFEGTVQEKFLNYSLSQEVKSVEASGNGKELSTELIPTESSYAVQMRLDEPISNLTLSFVTENVVFRSKELRHLFTEVNLAQPGGSIRATVKLPEGYALHNNELKPQGGAITSDGSRVILEWNLRGSSQPLLISVLFTPIASKANPWIPATIMLLIASILLYIRFRNRARDGFLLGFREDQKKAIAYMQQHKTAFQRDIQKEFQFSRAKATRIVKTLEEKGLIRKEEQGRTNKLFWLK